MGCRVSFCVIISNVNKCLAETAKQHGGHVEFVSRLCFLENHGLLFEASSGVSGKCGPSRLSVPPFAQL